jgi:ribulose-5-phosphate 4-epimerase/fuculose-1-phosphate aldolase
MSSRKMSAWGLVAARIDQWGFVIHSAVYLAQPNLVCALHTHTPANNAVAAMKEGLLPLNQKSGSIQHVLS